MTLNRALALVGDVAAALGGEPAGDQRRGCELSTALRRRRPAGSVSSRRRRCRSSSGCWSATRTASSPSPPTATRSRSSVPTPESWEEESSSAQSDRWSGSPRKEEQPRTREAAAAGATRARRPVAPPELPSRRCPRRHPVHTTASDGKATVEEIGRAAQALGYEYRDLRPHAQRPCRSGARCDDLRRRRRDAAANEVLAPFRILRGSECDILPEGPDLPDDVLTARVGADLPPCGAARTARAITQRVVEAMRHAATIKVPPSCLSPSQGNQPQPPARGPVPPGSASARSRSRRGSRWR